jgi:hypothetical protein
MNRCTIHARRSALAALALTAAGLVLVGCGSSSSAGSPAGSKSSPTPSSGSGNGNALFPVAVGNTWVYETRLSSLGERGTVTNEMTAVVPVASGQRVTMTGTFQLAGAAKTVTHSTYIFHSDGSITYPLSQLGGTGVSVSAGGVFWPPASAIASGRPYKSTKQLTYTQDGASVKRTVHVTVQGAGSGTVTVPAGTYHATIVDMTLATSVDGISLDIEVRTWIANGVGPVKSEALTDDAGASHLTSVQELKSFRAG